MSRDAEHTVDSSPAAGRAPLGWTADALARPGAGPGRASFGPPRSLAGDPTYATRRIPGLLRRRIRPRLSATAP